MKERCIDFGEFDGGTGDDRARTGRFDDDNRFGSGCREQAQHPFHVDALVAQFVEHGVAERVGSDCAGEAGVATESRDGNGCIRRDAAAHIARGSSAVLFSDHEWGVEPVHVVLGDRTDTQHSWRMTRTSLEPACHLR